MFEKDVPPLWAGGTYDTAGSIMSVPSWAGVVHATYTISPTLLNEAAFNFNGNNLDISAIGLYQKPSGYTVKNFFQANNDNKLPAFSIQISLQCQLHPGVVALDEHLAELAGEGRHLLESRQAQHEVRRVLHVYP